MYQFDRSSYNERVNWVHSGYPEILFADLGPDPILPDPVDTVLEVRLKG